MSKIPDYSPKSNNLSERARELESECRNCITERKGSEPELLAICRFFFEKIAELETEIKKEKE